ncbi:MAG: hypothetical protein WDN30_16150 [Pararobbsia sp.]
MSMYSGASTACTTAQGLVSWLPAGGIKTQCGNAACANPNGAMQCVTVVGDL